MAGDFPTFELDGRHAGARRAGERVVLKSSVRGVDDSAPVDAMVELDVRVLDPTFERLAELQGNCRAYGADGQAAEAVASYLSDLLPGRICKIGTTGD